MIELIMFWIILGLIILLIKIIGENRQLKKEREFLELKALEGAMKDEG